MIHQIHVHSRTHTNYCKFKICVHVHVHSVFVSQLMLMYIIKSYTSHVYSSVIQVMSIHLFFSVHIFPATHPAKAKSRKPADSPFTINKEGKLVIKEEEEEEEGAESKGTQEPMTVDEDMDVDEV